MEASNELTDKNHFFFFFESSEINIYNFSGNEE